jgi:hypothetical protein
VPALRRVRAASNLPAALTGLGPDGVGAEAGFVCVAEAHGFLRPLASTDPLLPAVEDSGASLLRAALASGECLTADARAPWAPDAQS